MVQMLRRNKVNLNDVDIDSATRRVCFEDEVQEP